MYRTDWGMQTQQSRKKYYICDDILADRKMANVA